MEDLTKVLIAIQSRSSSTRLPRKCNEPLGTSSEPMGTKRLLDHVIDACLSAARYSNRFTKRTGVHIEVVLAIPEEDPIKHHFGSQVNVIEGPHLDVLARYMIAKEAYGADYICRITGDCPLIPPFVISKHITLATTLKYDYISNVDERCRLSLDGIDCEVMSARLLDWLDEHAETPEEREHVTQLARHSPPPWASRAFTAGFFDQSHLKLSVDTRDDLDRVRSAQLSVAQKLATAEKLYGRERIHRF
jgi:spore coat polysaccharide biosynthesis protein SpsF (cytidylyltransferase family)